jgi:WhiB family redox-sensing transcriptional regulator
MNPSRSQLARQKNKEDAEFIEEVLESVTPGSLGEQCVGKFKYFYNEADDDSPAIASKEKVAKALCKQCPIMEKCLEDGLSQGDVPGIWGGMTKNERRNYANKRRRL